MGLRLRLPLVLALPFALALATPGTRAARTPISGSATTPFWRWLGRPRHGPSALSLSARARCSSRAQAVLTAPRPSGRPLPKTAAERA
eukprot:10417363-Alexandrium_andersonii.AAC.1